MIENDRACGGRGIECRSRLEFDTEFSATLCGWNKCETCRNNLPKECTRPPEIFGCAVRAGISRKPTPPRVPQRPSQYSAWRPLNRFTINHRGTRQPHYSHFVPLDCVSEAMELAVTGC